ncbi:MAG: hypothetical protein ACTHM0_13580 [Sphingomonas sp.]
MRLAQLIHITRSAGPDPVRTGAEPHPSIEARILGDVVRTYPHGGNSLEAAARLALRLGWRARHDLQRYQEEARKS